MILSIREQAWLKVALSLFQNLPEEMQARMIQAYPQNEKANCKEPYPLILKLVEIEAFNLERLKKNLAPLDENEVKALYQGSMTWGSLLEAMKKED